MRRTVNEVRDWITSLTLRDIFSISYNNNVKYLIWRGSESLMFGLPAPLDSQEIYQYQLFGEPYGVYLVG